MATPLALFVQRTGLTDAELLAQLQLGQVPAAPLFSGTPQTQAVPVSTDDLAPDPLSSREASNFFASAAADLRALFAASNDNDQRISALEALGVRSLSKLAGQIDHLDEMLQATIDLQHGYDQGYTIARRVNFLDDASIERDASIVGSATPVTYDPQMQAISLQRTSSNDILHTQAGTTIVDVSVDLQLGVPQGEYANFRSPLHALDLSEATYWGETILADEPITMPWPGSQSPYLFGLIPSISTGALAEYTIKFRQPQSLDVLVIQPYCELPINLAGVFVVKRDAPVVNPAEIKLAPTANGYSHYALSEYNSQRTGGMLFLNQTQRLHFPLQEEVLSLTLVFHQPHYTREVFSVSAAAMVSGALWQQMLGNRAVSLPPTATALDVTDARTAVPSLAGAMGLTASGAHTVVKYAYTYGAYQIGVYDMRHATHSTYVSTPISTTANLMQGTILADDDLPLTSAKIASTLVPPASGGWFGPLTPPATWTVPAGTIAYSLTYGANTQWTSFAPLGQELIFEPLILESPVSSSSLRLQARPGTPIYLTSFDGQGSATLLGAVLAPPVNATGPTTVAWTGVQLAAPGFYVIAYTPQDTSCWVDFGAITQAEDSAIRERYVLPGALTVRLPNVPFIDPARIARDYDANGDPAVQYVPISVSLSNLPVSFPQLADAAGHPLALSAFAQNTDQLRSLYAAVFVNFETLFSADGTQTAATFNAQHGNWVWDGAHQPQLFTIAAGLDPTPVPSLDARGVQVWAYDPARGSITFLNGNAGTSGQLALSYWYTGQARPCIINRTDYTGTGQLSLTPFDAGTYPFIEYVQLEDSLYFNLPLPASCAVAVDYDRLFDTVRVRADFTQVDPYSTAPTPHLYGFTFLGRDANGTSSLAGDQPEVIWGDLELYSLGITTQPNPAVSLIAGTADVNNNLPASVVFHWYRVVNAGSVTDQLRTNYDSSNGTAAFWDINADRYIEPDGNASEGVKYQLMNVDGTNTIAIAPGASMLIGLTNYLLPPSSDHPINPVTLYSSFTNSYLLSSNWLQAAQTVTKDQSIATLVLR